MPHPGFSWHELHVKESVRRLPAACLMEESGRLLEAASLLWPGRVRAKDILTLGATFEDLGTNWRHSAVCLSDHPWGTGLDLTKTAGNLLGDFRFSGRYYKPKAIPEKNREASRILVRSAFQLAYSAIPLIRNSGGTHRDKQADSIEDLLEVAEEAPYAALSESAVPQRLTSGFLGPRSIALFNSGIAASVSMIHAYRGGLLIKDRPQEQKDAVKRWSDISGSWKLRAERDFESFAAAVGLHKENANLVPCLIGAAGTASNYTDFSRDHYTDDETMKRVEAVAQGLSSALWKLTGNETGVDLCDLDSLPKPIRQIG